MMLVISKSLDVYLFLIIRKENNISLVCHVFLTFVFDGYRAFGYKGDLHRIFSLQKGIEISVCMINVGKFHTR